MFLGFFVEVFFNFFYFLIEENIDEEIGVLVRIFIIGSFSE